MATGSASYMREIFVEDLLWMSMSQQSRCSASIERAVLVYIRSV